VRRLISALSAGGVLALAPLVMAAPGDAVGPPAPTSGPVLHYAMDALTQQTVVDDSGNGLGGRAVAQSGAAQLVASLRGFGWALQLTGGQHQYVAVPSSPVLDVDTYTLSAWVRYTGVENDRTLGRWEVLEKAGAYWLNVRTNGLLRVGGFFGGCSGPNVWHFLDSTRALPVGRWKHVASTYDGAWLRAYIDGRAAGAKRVTGRTCVSGEPLAVGAKNNPTKGLLEAFWDGRLDDVRIYARALSPDELRQLATRP
jgi:hypothetical protein